MAGDDKKSKKTLISFVIRIGIAAAACWLIFRNLDFAQLADTFGRLHIGVLAVAIAVFLAAA